MEFCSVLPAWPLATSSCMTAGVRTLKPSWLGRFFGGRIGRVLVGTMEEGDGGADCSSVAADAVLILRVGGGNCRVGAAMFRDRFLVLRGFLPGERGAPWPKNGLSGGVIPGCCCCCAGCSRACGARRAGSGRDGAAIVREMPDVGDSGDELGEESVTDESTVDTVVVGDEFDDSEAEVDTLGCALCRVAKPLEPEPAADIDESCGGARAVGIASTVIGTCAMLSPRQDMVAVSALSSSMASGGGGKRTNKNRQCRRRAG